MPQLYLVQTIKSKRKKKNSLIKFKQFFDFNKVLFFSLFIIVSSCTKKSKENISCYTCNTSIKEYNYIGSLVSDEIVHGNPCDLGTTNNHITYIKENTFDTINANGYRVIGSTSCQ